MLAINLLPWRTEKRKQEKVYQLLYGALGLFFGIVCWIIMHFTIHTYLEELEIKEKSFEKKMALEEIEAAKAVQLKRDYVNLQEQQRFINQLKSNQFEMNEEFKHISLMLESPFVFKEIHRSNKSLIMKGEALSFDQVISFVWKWDKKKYFLPFKLKRLNHIPGTNQFYFVLMTSVDHK